MIHWTPLSEEVWYQSTAEPSPICEVHLDGVPLLVERISLTEARVVRLLSPCPEHFLDERFQPGAILSFSHL